MNMKIQRDAYLNMLVDRMHNGLIKVVTGVRRCGKTYLLTEIFHTYLVEHGVDEAHIIEIKLDDRAQSKYRNADEMYNFVKGAIADKDMYYVIIDEVQMLEDFVDVLNGFLHIKNADVYVTGSNSRFLSTDVITEFRGRGDEVRIYPLTFAEFYSARGGDKYEAWEEYCTYGGLPQIISFANDAQKADYLVKLFNETYILDILERNHIRHNDDFEELINILASSIGSLTNPRKLADTFKSVKRSSIAPATIKQYIDCLQEAFLISCAERYDVKGKRYISTPSKYYFCDVGIRNARLNFRQQEENHIMENVIYNELRARGFSVDVGVVEISEKNENGNYVRKPVEVDFVANMGSRRYYIQSAFELASSDKIAQERRPLVSIDDSFKKMIIVKDPIKFQCDEQGIVKMGIIEFLLNRNSLDAQ